ncbi:hypothetical protein GGR50DRAFT_676032, partial [Xylaria sp. CBS 124048]
MSPGLLYYIYPAVLATNCNELISFFRVIEKELSFFFFFFLSGSVIVPLHLV